MPPFAHPLFQQPDSAPSGAARATAVDAIEVAPPARFSTTTGCPRSRDIRLAMSRVMTSVSPPGAKPVTSVMGRAGQASCARARRAAASTTLSVARRPTLILVSSLIRA